MASGNGSKPAKSAAEVATELRQRLERRLGRERTDEIWQDPSAVQKVVEGEDEAADVAQIMLNAWQALPDEPAGAPCRRSGFRRGLAAALVTAVAVWSLFALRRLRDGDEAPQ